MPGKNRLSLTLQQRIEILKDLKTSTVSKVGKKYGVHPRTIRRVQEKASALVQFADRYKFKKKRIRIRRPKYEELENRLSTWFIEKKALGDYLSDAILLRKAAELKEDMPSCSDFKMSPGWLSNFKKRHNIRLLDLYDEKCSADEDAAKKIADLEKKIQEEELSITNIYNMIETVLLWKTVPNKTVAGEDRDSVSEPKIQKEVVSVALCANATGAHKVTPLVIYKYENPPALECYTNSLPVIFKSQKNAWMNQSLFLDWYKNHFKPSVREYQTANGISGKVVLLVDNYERLKVQESEANSFKIVYLPSNATSLIQPMDQVVIGKFKRTFRYKLLQQVLSYENGVDEFHRQYNIQDCLQMIQIAWNEVTGSNIRNSWKQVLPMLVEIGDETEEINLLHNNIQKLISQIIGKEDLEQAAEFLSSCEEEEKRLMIRHKEEDKGDNDNHNENEEDDETDDTQKISNTAAIPSLEETIQHLQFHTRNFSRPVQLLVKTIKLLIAKEEEK